MLRKSRWRCVQFTWKAVATEISSKAKQLITSGISIHFQFYKTFENNIIRRQKILWNISVENVCFSSCGRAHKWLCRQCIAWKRLIVFDGSVMLFSEATDPNWRKRKWFGSHSSKLLAFWWEAKITDWLYWYHLSFRIKVQTNNNW